MLILDFCYSIIFLAVVTLENVCGKELEILVNMVHCCETTSGVHESDCKSMFLIGGDMGLLEAKSIRNITLIYPNLVI